MKTQLALSTEGIALMAARASGLVKGIATAADRVCVRNGRHHLKFHFENPLASLATASDHDLPTERK